MFTMPAQEQRRHPSLTAEFGTPVGGAAVLGIVGVIAAIAGAPTVLIVAFVVLGAGLGAAVGAFWGVERGVGLSEDWEKTFEEPANATKPMRIGVYTNGDAETMRARHVLERHRPLDIQN